jgi:DNA-3-methyladenine glycosylase II
MPQITQQDRTTFTLVPRGPFSLEASVNFLCGFTPATGSSVRLEDGRLVLGFLDERRLAPVTVALRQRASGGEVVGEVAGADSGVSSQVARILSLDHDARGLVEIGDRDPVVRGLLEATPGFRPVCFPSPYEAAVWGVLAQRISMPVAAGIKQRLATATGTLAEGFGRTFHPSPGPALLLGLRSFPGLPAEKLARLHAVALAALDGKLDAAHLRAMPRERAISELRAIRGVGPWTAEHILLRGCGVVDELPTSEPRVLRGIAEAYGLDTTPSAQEALAIAESWRPFRMWVAVLMVMSLRATGAWSRQHWRKIDRAS